MPWGTLSTHQGQPWQVQKERVMFIIKWQGPRVIELLSDTLSDLGKVNHSYLLKTDIEIFYMKKKFFIPCMQLELHSFEYNQVTQLE